jgi:hypothetical protein
MARAWVALRTDIAPPVADRLNGKFRRVVVNTDTDPASIGGQIVDAIGHRPTKFLDQKIMHPHLFRIALRPPFPASIFEVSDKLLLLRIDRYNRLLPGQCVRHACADVDELRIAIGMVATLSGLAIGLQTKFFALEQFSNNGVTDFMPHGAQFVRETAQALAGPS